MCHRISYGFFKTTAELHPLLPVKRHQSVTAIQVVKHVY